MEEISGTNTGSVDMNPNGKPKKKEELEIKSLSRSAIEKQSNKETK